MFLVGNGGHPLVAILVVLPPITKQSNIKMDCRDTIQLNRSRWCNFSLCIKQLKSYDFMMKGGHLGGHFDFSVSSRIRSCCPPDMHYRDPNESIEKNFSFPCRI